MPQYSADLEPAMREQKPLASSVILSTWGTLARITWIDGHAAHAHSLRSMPDPDPNANLNLADHAATPTPRLT